MLNQQCALTNSEGFQALAEPALRIVWGEQLKTILDRIDDFETTQGPLSLEQKPTWLLWHHAHELERLGALVLADGQSIRGFAPFLLQQRPLKCYVGEFSVLHFNLRLLRFIATPRFPDDASGYDRMFGCIQALSGIDGVFLEALPTESFLFRYLEKRETVKWFVKQGSRAPREHFVAAIPDSYEEYAHKFSSKTRNTLGRRLKKLEKAAGGKLALERVTEEEQVDRFVENAVAVSKKTYQWHLLGLGLREPDRLKRELRFLARHGWARCYLLWCGETPTAFMLGYQDHHSCYYIDVGFDRDWADFSPGTVLQVMVMQDLFAYRKPSVFDFGGMAEHKKFFGNTSYDETDVHLFRRKPYPLFASTVSRAISGVADFGVYLLDRIGVKRTLKRWIRSSSVGRATS